LLVAQRHHTRAVCSPPLAAAHSPSESLGRRHGKKKKGGRSRPSLFTLIWNAIIETGIGVCEIIVISAIGGYVLGLFQIGGLSFALTAYLAMRTPSELVQKRICWEGATMAGWCAV
jgi:hypothetical protein